MTKFRIRLESGRVIGPFVKAQLFELKAKGHIKGNEEAQIFPTGNWGPINSFDFYPELMDENKTAIQDETPKEETFVIDLAKIRSQQLENETEATEEDSIPEVQELTETVRMETTPEKHDPEPEELKLEQELEIEKTTVTTTAENFQANYSGDRTLINPIAQEEIARMRREQKAAEDKRRAEEEEARRREEEEAAEKHALIVAQENAAVSQDEKTQVINLEKTSLLQVALLEETSIEDEIKKELKRQAKEEKEKAKAKEEEEEEVAGLAAKAKKKKIIIIAAAIAIIYALMFPEEEKPVVTFKHLEPQIIFPIPFDKADNQKSKAEFNRGLANFNKGTYPDLIQAGLSFKASYENSLENKDALNFLVRTYAEELKHSSNKTADSQTLFNIIQSKKPFLLDDVNGVIGLNLFYMAINKKAAAVDVVQKYLKLKPKDITQDLFAVYLKSLVSMGKIDLARQFYQALEKAPDKNRYAYAALIEYLLLNQETEKALEFVDDAIKRNPQIISFALMKAELLLKKNKVEDVARILKNAEMVGLDSNNLNRAKFFELKGLVYAHQKMPKEATAYFSQSLALNDSSSLRMILADLDTSEGALAETDNLINESKAYKLLTQANDFFNKRSYELALSYAAKATDAYPGHIPSELFLSKAQMKLGLAQQALTTLENLVKKYPDDKNINLALIDSYIETYKFHDARNRIAVISTTDIRESYEFASLNAKLYYKTGDILQSMSWLRNSVSLNPLNDSDIFLLAEISLRKADFDISRTFLNKIIELDPVNPDYRIAYAKLIYETQDDRAAIGYLLSLLDEFGESPKILAEIAIFYYRAGRVRDFQNYKEKLEKFHSKDRTLYEFLIKAALLDERYNDIPELVEKLLTIEPGELDAMMTAGRVLFENGKLVEAAKWFKRVQEKLPSYPKVLYYTGKIKFLSGDLDGALEEIKRNIKENGENDADLVFMAQIHLEKGLLLEAENLFKRAQKLNAKSYDAIVGMADLSTKRSNFDLALDLYKRALKLNGEEIIVHKKIGDVYRQLGQGALAIEAYKLYLEMDPDSQYKRQIEAYIKLMQ